MRWHWIALMAMFVSGCEADTLGLPLGEGDIPGVGDPARYACLTVRPEVLRFTSARGQEPDEKTFEVQSRCAWSVMLTRLELLSDRNGFRLPGGAEPRLVIPAGSVVQVAVAFVGVVGVQKEQGTLQPAFDDFVDAKFRVALEGVSIDAEAQVDTDTIDFGDVIYDPPPRDTDSGCASNLAYVHLSNVGYAPLNVARVWTDVTGGPFSVEFVEVMDSIVPPGMPFMVRRGERAQIAVRFRPGWLGRAEDVLRISHDAFDQVSEVQLLGNGVSPHFVEERFIQGHRVRMDILWVIDSSGSMEEEQARLLANLSSFVTYADAVQADYQMAVVQAQALENGAGLFEKCDPHPSVIHADYETRGLRDSAFRCLIDVGTEGFATESALGAARLALERARLGGDDVALNPNAGLLRPDADLTVVAVSDEDDQSRLPDDALLDALYVAKDHDRSRVKFHAVAGPLPAGCPYAERAQRYEAATVATNGRFFSICSSDWSPLLRDLGLDVFRPRYQWALRFPTETSTLVVLVNGVVVPSDPRYGYFYDVDRGVIVFNGNAVPPAGAEILVRYQASCPL